MTPREKSLRILAALKKLYPDRKPLLNYRNCFELTIAVILSAQCTDAQVNKITAGLFEHFPNPEELGSADIAVLEKEIHSAGFFKQKARFIKATAGAIAERFGGRVPQSMDELLTLPGVGRKSAHVIRGHCYGLPAVIVDTHFSRVIERTGLTGTRNPESVEKMIMSLLPRETWTDFSMIINLHGRKVCHARKPSCWECAVNDVCMYGTEMLGRISSQSE